MVQIVKNVASQQLDTDRGGMPQPRISTAPYEALSRLGSAIGSFADIGRIAKEKQDKKNDFKATVDRRNFDLNMGKALQDRAESDAMPEDGTGFHDDFLQNVYRPERDKFLAGLPSDELRQKYTMLLGDDGPDSTEWSIKAAGHETNQTQSWAAKVLGEGQNELANAISLRPEEYDTWLQAGWDEIDRSPLNTKMKTEQKAAWERMAQFANLNEVLEKNPELIVSDLKGDPRKLSPTTQYDILERALIGVESGGDRDAVSPKGALGLMQVMPGTAREIAKEIGDKNFDPQGNWDPKQVAEYMSNETINRRYGGHYLKKQIRKYGKEHGLEAALIAYNGGPGRADAWIKAGYDDSVIPKESADYYKKILGRLPGLGNAASGGTGKGDPNSVQMIFDRDGRAPIAGQGEDKVNSQLVDRVKTTFASLGLDKVKINSGYRSPTDNERVGGAKHSEHQKGNALDIDVSGYSHAERIQIIQTLSANGVTGIGVYKNALHADLGGRRAWGPSHGKESVPPWAKAAIDAHMAGTSTVAAGGGVGGVNKRYASLSYEDRQGFITKADQAITQRYNETSKATATQVVDTRNSMKNELASISATGVSTGFDETNVATVLGEDDYLKWSRDKEVAQNLYKGRLGIGTMTTEEMDERVLDFTASEGSDTYADDLKVQNAVVKEVERVQKARATDPQKAAMEYPDVAAAYEEMAKGMETGNVDPAAAQEFVRLSLERQKEFNLKAGTAEPLPREMAMQVGKSIAMIPGIAADFAGKNQGVSTVQATRAAIMAQYTELQKTFGEYTDEIIMHALVEYQGIGENLAEQITADMAAIQMGKDPYKRHRERLDRANDRDQQEGVTNDDGLWSSLKRGVSTLWNGETPEGVAAEEEAEAGEPLADPEPTPDMITRVMGYLSGATEEEEADIAARYPRAYDAAKRRQLERQQ